MINFINDWVKGIIIAVIISTIIEMILPNGTIKKYVRTVMGAYIIFVIVSPIITKITGKEISLNAFKLPEVEEYEQIETIDTNAYIERTYINKIKQDIIENIEKKGYKIENIELEIETKEENYGSINNIVLKISKQSALSNNIELIKIDISNENEQTETLQEEEIQAIKKSLQETYGTENIVIN